MKANRLLSRFVQREQRDMNQRWLIGYGVASNTNANLVAGVFLSGYLAYLGVNETMNGILMALPVLATVFQPVGAMMSATHGDLKKHVLTYCVLERVLFSALYCVPLLFAGVQVPLVAGIFLLANLATAIITPTANEWMMRIVPGQQRHEFFGRREIALIMGLVVTILAGGYMMDAFKGHGLQRESYFVLAGVVAVFSVAAVFSLTKVQRPEPSAPEKPRLATLALPLKDKRFMLTMGVICLYQFGLQLASPYWSIYQLSGLGLSYSFVNILTVCGLVLRVFVLRFLMKYLRSRSWSWVFGMSCAFIGTGHFLHTFTYYGNGAWYIWIPTMIANIGWGFLGLSMLNFQYDNIDKDDRSLYVAVGAVLTGLVGFLGSLAGGAMLEGVNALRAALPWFGMAGQQVQMTFSGLLLLLTWLAQRRVSARGLVR